MNSQEAELRVDILKKQIEFLNKNKSELIKMYPRNYGIDQSQYELTMISVKSMYDIEIIKLTCEMHMLKKMLGVE